MYANPRFFTKPRPLTQPPRKRNLNWFVARFEPVKQEKARGNDGLRTAVHARILQRAVMDTAADALAGSALYRGLSHIQYMDGSNMIIINRDDASGYRLDTLTTHCKHASPAVQNKDVLTTHTDYVNRSILQTTSYNFTGTKTTKEKCAGVVKAAKVFPKNPTQHC